MPLLKREKKLPQIFGASAGLPGLRPRSGLCLHIKNNPLAVRLPDAVYVTGSVQAP